MAPRLLARNHAVADVPDAIRMACQADAIQQGEVGVPEVKQDEVARSLIAETRCKTE